MSSSDKYLIFAIFTILTSCGPARVVTESQRDSVVIHVRDSVYVRDTIVMAEIPNESSTSLLPDTDTSYLQTRLAESSAYVKEGKLHHTLRNKSEMLLPVKVQYVDRARSEKTTAVGWRNIVETVEVEKQLSKWQNFIMTLGYGLLIAAAGWLVWKLSKIIRL